MSLPRVPFEQLPADIRQAVAGAVHQAVTARGGVNSRIAAVLETDSGGVFVKGIPAGHPEAGAQRREVAVAPHLPISSPRLYWHVELGGWSLLGYEVVNGRYADYAPGSPDLPLVEAALAELQEVTVPADAEIDSAVDLWAGYAPPGTSRYFDGDALLLNDCSPDSVLIVGDRARLVDWAWATRGPAWMDPGALTLRLMDAGHPVGAAVAFAGRFPSWRNAEPEALAAFGAASAAVWGEIAEGDGTPWKLGMAEHAATLAHTLALVP